jgi:outer membrane protein OmpA-like peptidoglycan-associated protein
MARAGIRGVVIQELFYIHEYVGTNNLTLENYYGQAFYPSGLYPGRFDILAKDALHAILQAADECGMHVTAVPVKGDLNNPKFAIGTVIREAIGNLIAKIVTAPFRALAGLFGDKHGKDDAGSVAFEPGSARLTASENEKLQEVAKVMSERPQLKLVVQAAYAPVTDRAAMKEDIANREIAQALGRSLEPGDKPAPIVFESAATQRALERLVAKKAADPAVVRDLAAQYAKRTGAEPKRAGMILRDAGDAEFYKAMYAWLVDAQRIGDDSMQKLAASRASAVLDKLRAAGADSQRLRSGPVAPSKNKDEKRVTAELSLEPVGAKPATDASEESATAQGKRKSGEL